MVDRRLTWGVGVAAVVAAIVFALPELVEVVADRRARARAEALPGDIDWERLEWFWTDEFRLHGIDGEAGPASDVRADSVDVGIDPLAFFGDGPVLRSVDASGLRASISRTSTSPAAEESSHAEVGRENGFELASVRERLSGLREVRLRGARVEFRDSSHPSVDWTGDLRWTDAAGLSGEGTASVERSRGTTALRWSLSGDAGLSPPSIRAVVDVESTSRTDGDSKLRVDVPPIEVAVDGIDIRAGARTEGSRIAVTARGLEASVAGDDGPALQLSGPKLTVVGRLAGRLQVRARDLRATVAPQRLLRRGEANPFGATPRDATSDSPSRRRLARRLLRRTDFAVRETTLDIRVRHRNDWRSYRPADDLDLYKRGRRLAASGKFAGGRAWARAALVPGLLLPRVASFRLRDVRLEEVPVVRKGRSLPKRGVRGKLGGTLDATGALLRTGLRGTLRERISATVEADWEDGWIRADGLAPETVRNVDLSVDLGVDLEPALERLKLTDSRASLGPMVVELDGSITDWSTAPQVGFRAHLREISCERAVRGLPDALLGPYRRVAIEGRADPTFTFDLPVDRPIRLSMELEGFPGDCRPLALNTLKSGWPKVQFGAHPRAANRPIPTANASSARYWAAPPDPQRRLDSPDRLDSMPSTWSPERPDDVYWLRRSFIKRVREGVDPGRTVRVGPGLPSYVPLQALPKHVAGAAYLSEEINFYSDGGWNMRLIEKAIQLDLKHEEFVYGGSTVTQQLVKNIFLTRRKTLDRKIQEALISWRIQDVVSKDRVLELYLNCIEYGDNLYGIGPAARHYFQKNARNLTPLEGVFLASIKPAPWYGERFRHRGTTPDSGWWPKRIREIMKRLVDRGFITEEEAEREKPYVLKWNEQGHYLPEAPESSDDPDDPEAEDESEDSEQETGKAAPERRKPTGEAQRVDR